MHSFPERSALPGRKLSLLVLALFVAAAYLYAFPQANLIYPAVVLLHALGGVVAMLFLLPWLLRNFRRQSWAARVAWLVLLAGGGARGGRVSFREGHATLRMGSCLIVH